MGILDWYDTDHDGRYDQGEIDRWQLDNGGYPDQFENERDKDDDNSDRRRRNSLYD